MGLNSSANTMRGGLSAFRVYSHPGENDRSPWQPGKVFDLLPGLQCTARQEVQSLMAQEDVLQVFAQGAIGPRRGTLR